MITAPVGYSQEIRRAYLVPSIVPVPAPAPNPGFGGWNLATATGAVTIAYGNNVYVATRSDQTPQILTSTDGVIWTGSSPLTAAGNKWNSLGFGNGLFVAASAIPSGYSNWTGIIATSTNGTVWTNVVSDSAFGFSANGCNSVSYANGQWIVFGYNNNNVTVYTSSTGAAGSWVQHTPSTTVPQTPCVYSSISGLYIGAGQAVGSVLTSSDAVNWYADYAYGATSLCYGAGKLVAVAGGGNCAVSSDGGVTWATHTIAGNSGWEAVTWSSAANCFEAVAYLLGSYYAVTSPDGVSWSTQAAPGTGGWVAVTSSPSMLVAVGYGVMTNSINFS